MVILKHRLQNHKVRNYFNNKTNSNAEKDIKIQKLFPAKIITSENLQDEIGEQIDKKLEGATLDRSAGSISERYNMIVNAEYLVCTTLLKLPKRKCQYWFDYEDPRIRGAQFKFVGRHVFCFSVRSALTEYVCQFRNRNLSW